MKARIITNVVFALPVIVIGLNYGLLQQPMNSVLERDDRNHGMSVRVHWRYYLDPTVVVYDLREVRPGTERVDVLRAFLQFAYREKDRHVGRVDLAWRGEARFSIAGRDFAELGRRYVTRSPVDTETVIPALVRRLDGTLAFPARSGPWAEEPGRRTADFDAFMDEWVTLGR